MNEFIKWCCGETDAQKARVAKANEQLEMLRAAEAERTRPRCPRCHSDNFTVYGKTFKAGRALVGAALVGPVGLLAGTSSNADAVCLNCGKKWRLK